MSDTTTQNSSEPAPSLGIDNQKLGVWALIGSEAVFFSALIVTYIVLRGRSIAGPLPRQILDIPLTGVNTFVLICSSLTMVSALASIQAGAIRRMRILLIASMAASRSLNSFCHWS